MSDSAKPAVDGAAVPKAETVPAPAQSPAVPAATAPATPAAVPSVAAPAEVTAPTAAKAVDAAPAAAVKLSSGAAVPAAAAPAGAPATGVTAVNTEAAGEPGATPVVTDSLDVVEGEGPTVDERLWATTLWLSTALMIFLPPIPVFLAPLIVKKLRKRPSEFVSWHASNSLRFASVATVFQGLYWACAALTALSLHRYWMVAFVPALSLYTSFAVGLAAWLTLVGHNAWKGRRHRPSELRNLVFYK